MNFLFAFAIGFSVASIPGPTILLITAVTLTHGIRAAVATMTAPILIDAAIMIPLGFLLQSFLSTAGQATLELVGSGFLLWLGVKSLRSVPAADSPGSHPESTAAHPEALSSFLKGALVHLTSPYPYIYWGTTGSFSIREGLQTGGVWSALLFPLGFWSGTSAFTVLVIYALARGKRFLPHRIEPLVPRFSGALLCLGGIYLGFQVWCRWF